MNDTQPYSPWTLPVLAWCWLVAIGSSMLCLGLLSVSAPGIGSSNRTTAAFVGA